MRGPERVAAGEERRDPRAGAGGAGGGGAGAGGAGGGSTAGPQRPRYGRYAGLLALLIVVGITVKTVLTKPIGAAGIPPGQSVAPFAVPLALGSLKGDADIATGPNQGAAGRVPACAERGAQILNVCQLYERGPLVLALFVDGGSCPAVLGDMQALAPSFPGVRFAAVSIKGDRGQLRQLVRSRGLTIPVGIDNDGALVALYRMASCPLVSFVYPGGVVQSKALLVRPALATLRARVRGLVAAARSRGWRGPAG